MAFPEPADFDQQFRREFARFLLEAGAWMPAYGISRTRKRIAVELALNFLEEMVRRLPPEDRAMAGLNLMRWSEGLLDP